MKLLGLKEIAVFDGIENAEAFDVQSLQIIRPLYKRLYLLRIHGFLQLGDYQPLLRANGWVLWFVAREKAGRLPVQARFARFQLKALVDRHLARLQAFLLMQGLSDNLYVSENGIFTVQLLLEPLILTVIFLRRIEIAGVQKGGLGSRAHKFAFDSFAVLKRGVWVPILVEFGLLLFDLSGSFLLLRLKSGLVLLDQPLIAVVVAQFDFGNLLLMLITEDLLSCIIGFLKHLLVKAAEAIAF